MNTLGNFPNGTTPLWPASGPVDFDCDGTITSPVIANINADCVTEPNGNCIAARLGSLPGFDDWAHLDFTGDGIGLRVRGLKPGRHRLRARPEQSGARTLTVSFRVRR
jgi:hypothetical protein